MQRELVCICPTCGGEEHRECKCPVAGRMRSELAEQVKLGKGRDDIARGSWDARKPGTARRSASTACIRPAWVFPYLVGGASLLGVEIVVSRWKKRRATPPARPAIPQRPPRRRREPAMR